MSANTYFLVPLDEVPHVLKQFVGMEIVAPEPFKWSGITVPAGKWAVLDGTDVVACSLNAHGVERLCNVK